MSQPPFPIYINDIPQAVQDSTVFMYADDISFCYQSHDLPRLNEAINCDHKKLDSWLQGNKHSLNVTKTHSMLISTKQKRNILKSQNKGFDLKIHDTELEVVKKTKYLGVQIDSSMCHGFMIMIHLVVVVVVVGSTRRVAKR